MIAGSGRWLRRLGVVVVTLAMLGAAGVGVLAWRLSQGPLPLDALARMMERYANGLDSPTRLTIGAAALVWEGFDSALDRPLDIRVSDVRVRDAAGVELAALPEGAVSLSLRALLLGRVVPRAIDLRGIRLSVFRAADGAIALDIGSLAEVFEPDDPATAAAAVPAERTMAALLADFGLGSAAPQHVSARFEALRLLRVSEAELFVDDRQLGGRWRVPGASLLVTRDAGTLGFSLRAAGVAQAGQARVALRLRGAIGQDGAGSVDVTLAPVAPAALAAALPGLSVLAAVQAPLSGTITASFGPDVALRGVQVLAELGSGGIMLPGAAAAVPLVSAAFDVTMIEGSLRVEQGSIVLPATNGPASTLSLSAAAEPRDDGSYAVQANIALDAVDAADVPLIWPAGVGGNERAWITENITSGTMRNANVTLRALVPATGDDVVPEHLEGTARGEGLTVHYLRPMPPLEGVAGEMTFGLASIDIAASGGRLSVAASGGRVGDVRVPEGTVRLYDLDKRPNMAEVTLRIETSVPDAMALLAHPKLGLIGRRGGPPPGITGAGEVRLTVGFPLIDELTFEELAVAVSAKASQVRVPAIMAGRDLERGVFDLTATPEGLRLNGTGAFGAVAATIAGEMDFRSGPATQVIERVTARIAPQQGVPALFDIDLAPFVTGPIGGEAVLETRRNGSSTATVKADLTPTRLGVDMLGVEKPPGQPGSAEARLTLSAGRLTGAEITRLEAGDIGGQARFVLDRQGRITRIEVPQARLGNSRLSGTVQMPPASGGRYQVSLRGAVLDVSQRPPATPVADGVEGQAQGRRPIAIDAALARVVFAPGRELTDVRGTATLAGDVLAAADIAAKAGDRGSVRAQIAPDGPRRTLSLTSDDAGALLNAIDVFNTMSGGALTVRGSYDDATAGRPLTGQAEIADFRLREAPAAGRVLQAMTLYGVLELARGPGLSFSRAIADFTLSDHTLQLRDARAYGPSLGFTAKGSIDRRAERLDLEGTIVPAYFFNSLLGSIPLIGRLFSPEQGGGLFAATYRVRGPMNDPETSVNPLAALTPGFLRGLFGIFEGGAAPPEPAPTHGAGPDQQGGG